MTQPPCQVRILTPDDSRFRCLCSLLDQGFPDLVAAECRRAAAPPLLDPQDGDVFLVDHLPAAGHDAMRLLRVLRARGCRQPAILLPGPASPGGDGGITLAEALAAGAADCLPPDRVDAFTLPRVVRGVCARARMDAYAAPRCSATTPCERARVLETIVSRMGSAAGRIDAAGAVVSMTGPLCGELWPQGQNPVGSSGFDLFPDGAPFLRRALSGESTVFPWTSHRAGRERRLDTFLFFDEVHGRSVVFLTRDVTEQEERAARALSESRQQFHMLLERSLDAILLVDDHGVCIEANDPASLRLGYAREQLVGRHTDEIGFQGFAPLQIETLTTTHLQSAKPQAQLSFTRPDGQVRLFEYAAYRAAPHFHLCILRDMTEQRRLEREILEVSDLEQQRFSQDLHDGLGQHLAGVGYMAEALAVQLRRRGAPEAAEAAQISTLVGGAITQAREIARGLYPADLATGRLPAMLARLAESFRAIYQTDCSFEEVGCDSLPALPRQTLLHLYRIAQEAASNAHRHGHPNAVAIRLACGDDVTLSIRDDGRGFEPPAAPEAADTGARRNGLGLHMMNYRATLLGGALTVRPGRDGAGTVVTCVFDPTLCQQRAAASA